MNTTSNDSAVLVGDARTDCLVVLAVRGGGGGGGWGGWGGAVLQSMRLR